MKFKEGVSEWIFFSKYDTNIVFASHLIWSLLAVCLFLSCELLHADNKKVKNTQFYDEVARDEKNVLVEHIAVM